MICEKYKELSLPEKWAMIGKITHLLQNDNQTFEEVAWLITMAEALGKLDNIKIMPETISQP